VAADVVIVGTDIAGVIMVDVMAVLTVMVGVVDLEAVMLGSMAVVGDGGIGQQQVSL
jgi:hypothetical protein